MKTLHSVLQIARRLALNLTSVIGIGAIGFISAGIAGRGWGPIDYGPFSVIHKDREQVLELRTSPHVLVGMIGESGSADT
jgi:hypothetical protein